MSAGEVVRTLCTHHGHEVRSRCGTCPCEVVRPHLRSLVQVVWIVPCQCVCSKGECVTGEGGRRQNKRFAENTGNFLIFKKNVEKDLTIIFVIF